METSVAARPLAKVATRRVEDLSGPRGLPVVGNLLQMDRLALHRSVEDWVDRYGPYFRFRVGSRRFVAVADHAALAGLLRDRPDGVRRSAKLGEIWGELGLPAGVFLAEGDAWKRQRRMVMAGFDPTHVRDYLPSLARVTERLHARWARAASRGEDIPLQPDLMRFTVDAIAGLAFGAEVKTLESDDEVIQQHLDKIFPALFGRVMSPLPYWRWWRRPSDRRLEHAVVEVQKAIEVFIAQARARLAADPELRNRPRNLLEAMLVASEAEGSGVGDTEVAGNVLTMLLAGEDTTANTLAWMLYLLARNPTALERAVREVMAACPDGQLDHERLDRLDFIEACAHETMRLKPVAPFLGLQLLRDAVVGDIAMPHGTLIWGVMRNDGVDDRYFPEAAAFRPERWLAEGGPAQAASAAKRVSMPFGAGPRVCPGRYLALLEMKMCMAMLLSRFELVSVAAIDGQDAREQLQLTMNPVGLRMRLRPRERAAAS